MSDSPNLDQITEISGVVERITYRNEQNGYTVAVVKSPGESTTVVGTLPFVCEGDPLKLMGRFVVNPIYGSQFKIESFERAVPEDSASLLRYLSSGIIKGVGPGTATRIVEKFGSDTLDVIQNHPEDLALIKGISMEKALYISAEYAKQFGVRDIMLMLSPYEISLERCIKIFRKLGSKAAETIKENPYVLCDEGINLNFELAERIAADYKISNDSEYRLKAGILYILRANLFNGHTCLPRKKLLNVAAELLESNVSRLEEICDFLIDSMVVSSVVMKGEEFIALPHYLAGEQYIAARLKAVKNNIDTFIPVADLEIEYIENKLKISFEHLQKEAIKNAFKNGVLVLTGGPGTGKTTTLNAIIELFEMRDLSISLCAPTGRAAKRMTELTGRDAMTIHRILEVEWSEDDDLPSFSKNERNPLECDVIIIDEASMIDSLLFESLLRALKISCRIIIVGDSDQLPSVSAGNVLGDILQSEMFPSICLKKVFRQADESHIIKNAHAIINDDEIDFSNNGDDFFLMRRNSAISVCDTVLELSTERLPKAYNLDPLKDIQILCPSRKLNCGTANLNNLLQSYLNPQKGNQPQMSYKGVYLRVGDKVMQIKNNYEIAWKKSDGESGMGVFNGDVGYIISIDIRAGIFRISFDDRIAEYPIDGVGEIELAYAITVHKSQGSEFECVILPLFDVPSRLLYRNILYTAVTRAKKMLIIVGDPEIAVKMAKNNKKTLRYTLLRGFLNEI